MAAVIITIIITVEAVVDTEEAAADMEEVDLEVSLDSGHSAYKRAD